MRTMARFVLPLVLCTVSCNSKATLPTAPSPLAATAPEGLQRMPVSAANVPFTLGSVAVSLGNEINATFLAAMLQGVPASSGNSLKKLMRDAVDSVIGVKLEAQSGFTQRCARGGTATVRYSGSTSGGSATLSSTEVVFSGCTYAWDTRTVTFHATLRATGTFRVSRPADPIHLEGEIRIDEIGGPFLLNGDTGPFLNGTIIPMPGATGGTPGETIRIGTPDISTTPGAPTTPGSSTPAPPASGPPPTIDSPPISGAPTMNITGTWGVDGQPAMSFIQNGATSTGRFLLPEIPIPVVLEVLENQLNGAVGGNRVHVNGTMTIRGGNSELGYITVQMFYSGVFDLVGTSLVGEGGTETRPSCTGLMKDFCLEPTRNYGPATLTRIGTVQSGTYDLSGRWSGAEMIQLQQDGGGGLSGSVLAPDIAEQSVSGRNETNRVSLRVRYSTRENANGVDYTRTVDRVYELTAYEPSSIGGFVTTVTTERCTVNGAATGFCADRNKTERTAGNAMLMRR